ncbi:MAG: hypothetical protein R2724_02285 [Bryobacterales bacterium]
MAARLADWAKVAAEVDQTIAIKAHVSSAARTCPNTSSGYWDRSAAATSAPPTTTALRCRGSTCAEPCVISCRNRFRPREGLQGYAAKAGIPAAGRGDTDYVQLLTLLNEALRGPVVVEVSASTPSPGTARSTPPTRRTVSSGSLRKPGLREAGVANRFD